VVGLHNTAHNSSDNLILQTITAQILFTEGEGFFDPKYIRSGACRNAEMCLMFFLFFFCLSLYCSVFCTLYLFCELYRQFKCPSGPSVVHKYLICFEIPRRSASTIPWDQRRTRAFRVELGLWGSLEMSPGIFLSVTLKHVHFGALYFSFYLVHFRSNFGQVIHIYVPLSSSMA